MDTAVERLREFHSRQGARSGRGLEAMIAGATRATSKQTWLLPGFREMGAALLRGASEDALHRARPYRVVPPGSSPTARIGQAVGLGLAGESALCFVGTGSLAYGTLVELAPFLRPGVQFVGSYYTRPGPFAPPASPSAVLRALGFQAVHVDGSDEDAVAQAVAAGNTLVLAEL